LPNFASRDGHCKGRKGLKQWCKNLNVCRWCPLEGRERKAGE